jgi:hypothetical protein
MNDEGLADAGAANPFALGFVVFFVWTATEENQLGSETGQGKCRVDLGFVGSLRLTLGAEMPS